MQRCVRAYHDALWSCSDTEHFINEWLIGRSLSCFSLSLKAESRKACNVTEIWVVEQEARDMSKTVHLICMTGGLDGIRAIEGLFLEGHLQEVALNRLAEVCHAHLHVQHSC